MHFGLNCGCNPKMAICAGNGMLSQTKRNPRMCSRFSCEKTCRREERKKERKGARRGVDYTASSERGIVAASNTSNNIWGPWHAPQVHVWNSVAAGSVRGERISKRIYITQITRLPFFSAQAPVRRNQGC